MLLSIYCNFLSLLLKEPIDIISFSQQSYPSDNGILTISYFCATCATSAVDQPGGHEHAKAGGDAVWAAGAVAVTVPTCWFLISNKPESSHGHGGHGDSHGAHAEEHEEEEEKPEEKKDDKPAESEEKPEEKEEPKKSDESDSDDETKDKDTPATSDDESIVGETDKNVRKSVPDAKGGNKVRLESKAAIKQGEDSSEGSEEEPLDKAAASKEPQGKSTQSGKQEGLSNTDTKHSTDITNDPSKSKKSEGAPETAKVKGTVDPNRPQPEEESDS
ncbi:hypothetical protein DID88_004846 [Monilinia fructigena]|uniref:Uncharacterized protein n=1 Tax=Monilinia fructigena TaxID=38457 RepID=A0A395IVA7_9HELO|nr:hypothetical protein DID88_004846 [Monilinia fructigena]